MAKDEIQLRYDNFKNYKDKIGKSLDQELSLFDRFASDVISRAKNHHQVTLNNLEESKESLAGLKNKVKTIKNSIFYHDETLIIDRQAMIQNTEKQIQAQNQNILEFDHKNTLDKVLNFDYLNKALLQSSFDFFAEFRMYYAKDIFDLDDLYDFLKEKNKVFEKIIQKYEHEVMDSFTTLDKEITDMNDKILNLMQQKNTQLNKITDFYQNETDAYLDNQLTFSVENNLNSEEIKSLIADKLKQFKNFKVHLLDQEEKIKIILHEEYLSLYNKVVNKLLQRKGDVVVDDPNFFEHIDDTLVNLKEQIVFAKNEDLASLSSLIKTYNYAINYKQLKVQAEKKARKMTSKFLKMKKAIFFEYQKESRSLINQMDKYYHLYLDLLKVDPFLAQIIGDKATKIVKDEINYLTTLKINKEHKINVNFDIKTLKLNQKINDIEAKLIYEVERQILLQDIDLLNNILDIQNFFIDKQADTSLSKNHLHMEKHNIFRLDKAINSYLKQDMKITNINRKYLNFISGLLVNYIRDSEAHNIAVVDSLSDIKLALKEYDIASVHFRTMFENEQRFLVMQSNRVNDETKINDEFILTGLENQMRFAQEQINLANDEFRLRVEAIMTAVDEERVYYNDIITNQEAQLKQRRSLLMDEYQSKVYHYNYLLEDKSDSKTKKTLEKEFDKLRENYELAIKNTDLTSNENQAIIMAKRRLVKLDDHLEEALDEATSLRDQTIDEMQELYRTTKEKYDYLKVYLDQRVYPLEPTFHQTLERMKGRYEFKRKTAEAELDVKTKDLLDKYLKVYFEEQPGLDLEKVNSFISQMEAEKEAIAKAYEQEIIQIEETHQSTIDKLKTEKNKIIEIHKLMKQEIVEKEESEIIKKQAELQNLESKYLQQQTQKQISFDNEIENLTNEYNTTLVQSKKYINNLSQAFDKVLETYKPYLRLTKNNRKIRMIVNKTNRQIKRKQKDELHSLAKDLKSKSFLINE